MISAVSKKALTSLMMALTVAGTLAATSTDALAWRGGRYNGGAVAAGVVGGLALGALAAGAIGSSYAAPAPQYYSPPPPRYYAPAPVYYDEGPSCYTVPRRVWVDGWGWRMRRVPVCD